MLFPYFDPESRCVSQEDFIEPRPLDLKGFSMLRKTAVSKNETGTF